MRLTSLGDQELTKPQAFSEYSDDALVDEGTEAPKPRFSPVKMRKLTPVGSLLHVGSASTYKAQRINFSLQSLPWSFRETIEERNIRKITRQTFDMYNLSWHLKVMKRNQDKVWFLILADG